jgi:hypothetical protein
MKEESRPRVAKDLVKEGAISHAPQHKMNARTLPGQLALQSHQMTL